MNKKSKKIMTFALALSMVMGMGSMAVSADELEMVAEETQAVEEVSPLAELAYEVCPEIDLSDAEVIDTLDKIYELSEEENLDEEMTADIINVLFGQSVSTYSTVNAAKDFFAAVGVNAGKTINGTISFDFYYNKTYIEPLNGNSTATSSIVIGNAVPTLTRWYFNIETINKEEDNITGQETGIYDYYTSIYPLNNVTTSKGNIITLQIKAKDASGNIKSGPVGYNLIRNNSTLTAKVNGISILSSQADTPNEYIGSLGDMDNNGYVEDSDRAEVIKYILHERTLNDWTPLQIAAADVTENGEIDIRDYTALKNYVNGNLANLRS